MVIQPQPGSLAYAQMVLPTIRGPVFTRFESAPERFRLEVRLPANTTARVMPPRGGRRGTRVMVDGRPVRARAEGTFVVVDSVGAGRHLFELR